MRAVGLLGALWGSMGVLGMLAFAVYRLGGKALGAFEQGLTGGQWVLAAAVCVFMAYTEGYRGFQLKFSPRTAARVRYLRDHPDPLRSLLAPLFVFGFFHATRRTTITAYVLSVGILILVLLVHQLAQPWRGIIDAGVVIGLSWGLASLGFYVVRALTSPTFAPSPEVP